ncbi:GntR family transcriptional regulator [Paenarthrobacter nicotinovorans]|uniref:GntR family transcriptional regulator n=1 Tax=Paenarthrobacter nicotinovorans TaxID=29320 RepID=UPI00381EF803
MTVAADVRGADGDQAPAEALSMRDSVYQALRSNILHGVYRPNDRLVERDIAADLQASRTPVREALLRLVSEGLVVKGRNGLKVHEFTFEEVQEVYEVRAALEGYAGRLAAERATPDDIAGIQRITEDQQARLRDEKLEVHNFVEMNDQFHDAIIAAARNARLTSLLRVNRTYFFNFRLAALYTKHQTAAALDEHQAILAAIARRDADEADRLIRHHTTSALAIIRQSY